MPGFPRIAGTLPSPHPAMALSSRILRKAFGIKAGKSPAAKLGIQVIFPGLDCLSAFLAPPHSALAHPGLYNAFASSLYHPTSYRKVTTRVPSVVHPLQIVPERSSGRLQVHPSFTLEIPDFQQVTNGPQGPFRRSPLGQKRLLPFPEPTLAVTCR